MNHNPETCGGEADEHDLPVAAREVAEILPTTTFAELQKMPIADIIAKLVPNPIKSFGKEYGPMASVFKREMIFGGIGSKVSGHAHDYDHMTDIIFGTVNVLAWRIDPKTGEHIGDPVVDRTYVAPASIFIAKEMAHELTALTENVRAYCVYALRDSITGEVVEKWDGNMTPYSYSGSIPHPQPKEE